VRIWNFIVINNEELRMNNFSPLFKEVPRRGGDFKILWPFATSFEKEEIFFISFELFQGWYLDCFHLHL
jgi:hypothetical protein